MQITTILVLSHVVDKNYQILITRRAVAERAENIGIWFKILEMLAQLAVISNVRAVLKYEQILKIEKLYFLLRLS